MSKYKPLYSNLWNDPDFENFTVEQKLIFIFLITNSGVEKSGIYKITVKQISFYTDTQKEVINEFINKLINLGKIKYDFENGIIFIKNVFKFQKGMIKNKKIMFICLLKNYQMVKTEFWQEFFSLYSNDEIINEFINENIDKEIKDLIINKKPNETKNKKIAIADNLECKSQLDYFCDEMAISLKEILGRKLNRNIATSNWNKEIKLIVNNDLKIRGEQQARQDLIRCIQAIENHYGKEYFPVIQSAKSLREKFIKIENYLAKTPEAKKNNIEGELKQIESKLKDFGFVW